MPTSTLARPRPALESSVAQGRSSARPSRHFVLMVAGAFLLTSAFAATALGRSVNKRAPVVAASGFTIGGPNDVSVVNQVYAVGESSGWHRHTGIHAVAVLSGTLTVYDGGCQPQLVVPGRPYVGGQELHLARNERTTPVEMVVTYMSAAGATSSTVRAAADPCPGLPQPGTLGGDSG